jgi:phage shock protein C
MPTGKKLCRSNDRIIAGVCAGIAEYFDVDPTIIRIVYAVLTIGTAFCGIILYPILWLIMPPKN